MKTTREETVLRFFGAALKPATVRLAGGFVKTVEKKVERTVCCLVPTHGVTSHLHPILDKPLQFLLSVPHTLKYLYATSSAVPSLRSQTRRRSRLVLSSVCPLSALSGLMMEESSRLQRFPAVNVAHNSSRLPAPFCSQIIRRGPSVLLFGCFVPALSSARSLSFFFLFFFS